jgi:DNA helicase IV
MVHRLAAVTGGAAVATHRELEAEQAHVDRAYLRLDQLRADAEQLLRSVLDQGSGGTHQFREERDVIVRTSLARLDQLDIGDQALCFGRIDRLGDPAEAAESAGVGNGTAGTGIESFHIGRLGVSGEGLEPLVVDWRAPVAEPFYRATGRDPMGLVLRRHLAAQGRTIVGIEDERFGADDDRAATGNAEAAIGGDRDSGDALEPGLDLGGPGALLAVLGGARTGVMRDIVSTIQREQDEIIRSTLPGVLVVQGGPGTGKTAVALHRAAYLLYTHRFPLERQGVLVIGPNPLFLRYIEQVLPSLGESGVTLSTITGLVHGVQQRGQDEPAVARLKGEARMADLVARAIRTRQRPLRHDVEVPFGSAILRLSAPDSATIVAAARRRPGTHNRRRRFVEQLVVRKLADDYLRSRALRPGAASTDGGDGGHGGDGAMVLDLGEARDNGAGPGAEDRDHGGNGTTVGNGASLDPGRDNGAGNGGGSGPSNGAAASSRPGEIWTGLEPGDDGDALDLTEFSRQVRRVPALAEALDRMWPQLSAEELLHDLFGARPLLRLAGRGVLSSAEQQALFRPRSPDVASVLWTAPDLALLDEARVLLGSRKGRPGPTPDLEASPRTYGHIVVDEAQDLSPMELRMVGRRSLSGSITVVGDVAQATGPWAPPDWGEVTRHLPAPRPARTTELTVSYRTPAEVVEVAARVLAAATPGVRPPRPVRRTGVAPVFEQVGPGPGELARRVAERAGALAAALSPGTAAVLAPASLIGELALALDAAGVAATDPRRDGLGAPLSLLPVDLANGLEFDGVVVVEPAAVEEESPQGLRALYVALTRPTRQLVVVHARPLPASLHP